MGRVDDLLREGGSFSCSGTADEMIRYVERAQLKNGDEIMIGKFRLVFFTKSAVIS